MTPTSYYATVPLTDNYRDIIKYIELEVAWSYDNGKTRHHYGSDIQFKEDDDGRLVLYKPTEWPMINGHCSMWRCYSADEDGRSGFIPIIINNEIEAALYIVYDNEHPKGYIKGYVDYDIKKDKYSPSDVYSFKTDDVINLAYLVEDEKNEYTVETEQEQAKALELVLTQGSFRFTDYVTVYGRYIIHDTYGNKKYTEYRELVDY